ncbi:hypothetical protein LY90DRAFT_193293 [Neocallimastix californiae]|uniref:Uncharacterized protein n=1 Tax=Neocallimastix californiae TaxID=1754190 RepID=A0A1Y2ELJ7_9FUNG|nr:hypothetical protein LY90DRAFT_193293 [Neocallimastix californiae]|eukprot:ORY72450.1 hypothetical protein LY90DRAFT_193293 [Neocallimastix californiae]
MTSPFPVNMFPAFNTRSTRTFPTTGRKTEPVNDLKKSRVTKTKSSKEASDDYIRNLQQQIYLLELETRYLRSSKARGECGNLSNLMGNSSTSLNEVLNGLKYKYVELQEKNKKNLEKLEEEYELAKGENIKKETEIQRLKGDIEALRNEVDVLKARNVDDQKELCSENVELKKKLENITSEVSRSDLSYQRVVKEKEELLDTLNQMKMNHSITDEKYEDLNNVVDRLKQKLANLEKEKEELKEKNLEQANIISNIDLEARQMLIDSVQNEKIKLMSEMKRLEYAYAEEKQQRDKIFSDRDKIIEENVALNNQIEELKRKLESVR